jgi:Tol biopolymer transport system component
LQQLSFAGEAFRIAGDATDPSISSDGTLVYRDAAAEQLVWVDRQGSRIGTVGQPANGVYYPALSPDGHYVAVETMENENLDVWVVDISRGTRIRLTSDPAAEILPAWAPEGDAVAFSSYRTGNTDIFVRPADARIEERPIANTPASERVSDWSRDGQYVLYSVVHQKSGYDVHYLKRSAGGKWESHAFLQTEFNEKVAKFSPNGRFVAYLSDESGRDEVYVRQFPCGGRTWPVSAGGAAQIRWSRNGRELFYAQMGTLIATSVRTEPEFAMGPATRLFSHGAFNEFWDPNYDVSADGERILLPESVKAPEERAIHVVQNWFAEFKDRR